MPSQTATARLPAALPARFPLLGTALLLAMVACRAAPTPAPAGEAPATPAAAPASAAAPAASAPAPASAPSAKPLPAAVAEGKPYAGVREALLADGWLPLRDPECRSNIGGDAPVCDELPEVESCSSDGYCNMEFADGTRRLEVTTYGPNDRWNTPGQESALQVKSTELLPLPAAAASAQCPSADFDAFLKAFASDAQVRSAFTAPLVKVAELHSDDEGDHERMVYVARDKYTGFNVGFSGGAFHFIDSTGQADQKPLALHVTRESDDSRFLSYDYNLSEGNSYRFQNVGGCWSLTQDPEMPSP